MITNEIVGIDVSKVKLDLYILRKKYCFTVNNNTSGFNDLIDVCCTRLNCTPKNLFFCFENTGRYSRLLSFFLSEKNVQYAMVSALDVKKSKGLLRGKSDRKDAKMLAHYAKQRTEYLSATKLQLPEVSQLRQLLNLRNKLLKHRTAYKSSLKDLLDIYRVGESDFIRGIQHFMVDQITKEIKVVEQRMDDIIASIPGWSVNVKLIRSVKGIGPVLTRVLIISTENFTRFSDPKKFASYVGIAPFEYSSGSSVNGRMRVHPCANKQIKCLLNIAAMSVIQYDGEYKSYYERRAKAGKNNMSTLNVIRNKLVHRVFAAVREQKPYVDKTLTG